MANTPPLKVYRKIAAAFIVLIVILVFVIFYYSLTYAFVSVKPTVQEADYAFNFLVSEESQAADIQKGIFNGVIIDQVLEASDTFQATGEATLKSDVTGRVVIINNFSRNQPLVQTTRLLTSDGVLFRIDETIQVPAGGRVEVNAYQDDASVPVGVEVGDRFTIPGLSGGLQELIYAEAITEFSGDEEQVSVVSKEDLDRSVDMLVERLKEQIRISLPSERVVVLNSEIISKEFSELAGSQSENFTSTISANIFGVAYTHSDVETFARLVMENNLDIDRQLVEEGSFETAYEIVSVDTEHEVAQMRGEVKAEVILRNNAELLRKDKLVGLNGDQAKVYLENFAEIESAEVSFFPFWVKKIPTFQDHIIIDIER